MMINLRRGVALLAKKSKTRITMMIRTTTVPSSSIIIVNLTRITMTEMMNSPYKLAMPKKPAARKHEANDDFELDIDSNSSDETDDSSGSDFSDCSDYKPVAKLPRNKKKNKNDDMDEPTAALTRNEKNKSDVDEPVDAAPRKNKTKKNDDDVDEPVPAVKQMNNPSIIVRWIR